MVHIKPKLFRDPVHDTIAVEKDQAMGRLVLALIDTPEMQRLRRIRQLGFSFIVYPGAEHSRFQHSLGVMWLATQMLARLGTRVDVDPDEALVTVAASLLHDVGHGPFSHALEAVTGVHHEVYSDAVILSPDSGVNRALTAVDASLPARVASRLKKELDPGVPPFHAEIVSSQLDADRLDYIMRDGVATGVKIGKYDLLRILTLLDVVDGHLAVHLGAREAVEGYLLARFHMYKQVYLHKTSRVAERMLEGLLRRASQLRRDGYAFAWFPDGALGRLIEGERLDASAFVTLDDMDVWVAIKRWQAEPDKLLAQMCNALVDRRLWKPVVLPNDAARAEELTAAARSIARVSGYDPAYAVLVDTSEDSLYRPYTGVGPRRRSIRLVEEGGGASFIEDRSEVMQMLAGLQLRQRLLCVHPALREKVRKIVDP